MTVAKLIKLLQKLPPRLPVCADTETLRRTCNDVWQIVHVTKLEVMDVNQVDGDGWMLTTKKGVEITKTCLVLK